MSSTATQFAQELFDGIAPRYDIPAELLSFGQYGRWRRHAVSRLHGAPGSLVLDVATGTGLVARDIIRRRGMRAVGVDLSFGMLARARTREPRYPLIAATGERLPLSDASVDGLAFTYLLRYVPDPPATLQELVRVVKPGGSMVSVEFGLPRAGALRSLWDLYSRRVLPLAARAISPQWHATGKFLGGSIVDWGERYGPDDLARMWRDAGMTNVRAETLSFGAGVVMSGIKRGDDNVR